MNKTKTLFDRDDPDSRRERMTRRMLQSCSYCKPNRGENATRKRERDDRHKTHRGANPCHKRTA